MTLSAFSASAPAPDVSASVTPVNTGLWPTLTLHLQPLLCFPLHLISLLNQSVPLTHDQRRQLSAVSFWWMFPSHILTSDSICFSPFIWARAVLSLGRNCSQRLVTFELTFLLYFTVFKPHIFCLLIKTDGSEYVGDRTDGVFHFLLK